ncbi:MAG: hypothetical protein JO199_13975 [Candidatus Eremiobacteraeota bacterium]|nr:hypothetical protein [Candidatus Eremiobacteraeota bacterium]
MAPVASSTLPFANTGAHGALTVSLQVPRGDLVDLSRAFPRLKHRAGAAPFVRGNASPYKSLLIDGEIWPSYAGAVPITATATAAAPSSSSITATVTFGNVPKGNNEFVVLSVYGVASNGAQTFLGNLSTMANVTSATPKVSATLASTLTFQAMMAVIQAGFFSAADVASSTTQAQVEAEVKAQALKANPATGLYDSETLVAFVQTWEPKIERVVQLTIKPSADYVTIANDATDAAENMLFLNESAFQTTSTLSNLRPYGAPCKSTLVKGPAGLKQTIVATSCYAQWPGNYGSTLPAIIVYGGPLLLGQVSYATPYTGSMQKAGPLAQGAKDAIALDNLSSSANALVVTHDAADWAFGTQPSLVRRFYPNSAVLPGTFDATFDPNYGFAAFAPGNWGASHPAVDALAWNPWNLPSTQFQICSWNNACVPLGSTKTLDVNPPFHDPGTKISYYQWAANQGSGLAVEPWGSCTAAGGYQFTLNGSHLWSMSTTRTQPAPIWFEPQQWLYFAFHTGNGCNVLPAGSTITVTARGKDGYFYTSSVKASYDTSSIFLYMDSVNRPTVMTGVTISGTVPPATITTLDLNAIQIGFGSNLYYNGAHGKPGSSVRPTSTR